MFKVNIKNTRTISQTLFLYFYSYLSGYFTAFSSLSIVDFEQVNVSWEALDKCLPFYTFQEKIKV